VEKPRCHFTVSTLNKKQSETTDNEI